MTRPDIWQMVKELTQPHTHVERITRQHGDTSVTEPHFVKVPALLDQLDGAIPLTAGVQGGGAYASKPAGNLEALDVLVKIDLDAARWLRDLGEDDPGSTKACVRKLGSLLPSCQKVQAEAVERDIGRWWAQSRVASGWDTKPWKPDNTCPLCAERGTIRIRLADEAGFCTSCSETWDSTTIGLLAEHIRAENGDELAG